MFTASLRRAENGIAHGSAAAHINEISLASLRSHDTYDGAWRGHPQGRLTPSHRVDLAWHEFILFTRDYAEFCATQFGKFIHHSPGGETSTNQQQFALTIAQYQERFGTPNPEFWGRASSDQAAVGPQAECGPCETDTTDV